MNENFLATINPEKVEVEIFLMESESPQGIEQAELDVSEAPLKGAMWSLVGNKHPSAMVVARH